MPTSVNPYEAGPRIDEDRPERRSTGLVYLSLFVPPGMCVSIMLLGHQLAAVTGGGPVILMLQLLLMSLGSLIPALVVGTIVANWLGKGKTLLTAALTVIEWVAILLAWQQTFSRLPGWS